MKNLASKIIQYVLYFKSLFWTFLALIQFIFPVSGTVLPIHSFLFLLNGIVFFCIGFSFTRAHKDIFRGAVVFLGVNIFLVLMDGFSVMDVLSILLDVVALMVLFWFQGIFSFKKED
jgi:hypothetical protein